MAHMSPAEAPSDNSITIATIVTCAVLPMGVEMREEVCLE